MNKKRRRKAPVSAPPRTKTSEHRVALSWWRNLGKGPKWLALTITPLILAAAVPGILPWAVDRTRDLFGEQPLSAYGENRPEHVLGMYWATNTVFTELQPGNALATIQNHAGAQIGTSGHQITLESNRSGRIDLVKITAVVESRRPPLAGTAFIADPQGIAEGVLIDFRLDSGNEVPGLVPTTPGEPATATTPYIADGRVRYVEQGKPEHLIISAHTTMCYCQWRVHIEYLYRGSRGEIVVPPPSGNPFATTAWTAHKFEYELTVDKDRPMQRRDCVAEPTICRTNQLNNK